MDRVRVIHRLVEAYDGGLPDERPDPQNSLATYILFRESTSDPDVQNIITTELVKAVFSHEETGFLDRSGEKTINEEQSNLLGLLGALRKS